MISFKDWVRTVSLISTVLFLFFTPQAAAISLTATDDASIGSKSHKSKHANDGDLFIEDWSRNRQAYEDDDDDIAPNLANNDQDGNQDQDGPVLPIPQNVQDDAADTPRRSSRRIRPPARFGDYVSYGSHLE